MNYKVIKIINEYEIIINAGFKDGIRRDQILEVYELGKEVTDPETEKSLGTLDHIKAELIVDTVYENMALCSNNKYKTYNKFAGISEMLMKTEKRKFKIDPEEITSFGIERDYTIRLGDQVRKAL